MSRPAYELTRCIACGSANSTLLADETGIRDEVERVWAFHGARLHAATPPARLMDRVAFSQAPPLRVVECARCGLVYRNPIERAWELEDAYAATPNAEELRALFVVQHGSYRSQAKRLRHALGRRGSVVEVGSYVGAFLAAARDAGLEAEGVDVNPDVNQFARGMGFVVHDGELASLAGRRVDAVAIWNCLDQLADPGATISAAAGMLGPGGILTIRVPHGRFYATLRRHLADRHLGPFATALLAHNNLLGFPYRFGFGVESLRRLLTPRGFAIDRVVGDTLVPIADAWTRRWAAVEERAIKGAARLVARARPAAAPWIEVYARRLAC